MSKKPTVFDFVNDLSHKKQRLIDQDPDHEKLIKPFMINRAFSFAPDTVLYANEMNKASDISNRMLYDYYYFSLRPKKRYNKWAKKQKVYYLEDVSEYFGYSTKRAAEILPLLTMENLESIRKTLDRGGRR